MFDATHYEVRQKFSLGNRYNVYEGDSDDPILTSAQKKFRLREDFRFVDPDTDRERFRVKAGSVLDIATAYDVVDSGTGDRIGTVERSATSFFRHEYALRGPDGDTLAFLREDSALMAMVRRFITTIAPFSYDIVSPEGRRLGEVSEALSLRDRYTVDLHDGELDPRLVVVATVVVDAIEGN